MDNNKPFLVLSEWWGFANAGTKEISVQDNGSYLLKKQSRAPQTGENNSSEKTGIIDSDRLLKLKSFLKENITENSSAMIFDAGYDIEYFNGDVEIKIKNNQTLWKQIKDLLPEYSEL